MKLILCSPSKQVLLHPNGAQRSAQFAGKSKVREQIKQEKTLGLGARVNLKTVPPKGGRSVI